MLSIVIFTLLKLKIYNNFIESIDPKFTNQYGAGVRVLNVVFLSFIRSCVLGQRNGFKLK